MHELISSAILGLALSDNRRYFICPFLQQHTWELIKKDHLGINFKLKHRYYFYIIKTVVYLVRLNNNLKPAGGFVYDTVHLHNVHMIRKISTPFCTPAVLQVWNVKTSHK